MRIHKDRDGRVGGADGLQNLGVGELREAAAAELLRHGHAEDAEPPQAVDYGLRNFSVAIDGGRVHLLREKTLQLGHGPLDFRPLGGAELRIRRQQCALELAEEQALGEAELLFFGK